jgi:hypothetical protein
MDHFKKSISSAIKKRKLTIISQSGTTLSNDLRKQNKIINHKFTMAFIITASMYPKIIMMEMISPSGGCGTPCIITAIKKQKLQIKATLDKRRKKFMLKMLIVLTRN